MDYILRHFCWQLAVGNYHRLIHSTMTGIVSMEKIIETIFGIDATASFSWQCVEKKFELTGKKRIKFQYIPIDSWSSSQIRS